MRHATKHLNAADAGQGFFAWRCPAGLPSPRGHEYGALRHSPGYGMIRHMKAVLAFHDKQVLPDGAIVEMKIWQVPQPVPGSAHALKYSLFYGRPGERIVGYDNERGKGDHRHVEGQEECYAFTTPGQLIADFLADVRRLRGES